MWPSPRRASIAFVQWSVGPADKMRRALGLLQDPNSPRLAWLTAASVSLCGDLLVAPSAGVGVAPTGCGRATCLDSPQPLCT